MPNAVPVNAEEPESTHVPSGLSPATSGLDRSTATSSRRHGDE